MNLNEIIDSWIISIKPSEEQKILAKKRVEICNNCEEKKIITRKLYIGIICRNCGCPINKKIFSPKQNPCPLKKWEQVDNDFFKSFEKKNLI